MAINLAIQRLNQINRDFWARENAITEQLAEQPEIVAAALELFNRDMSRLPFKLVPEFVVALRDAAAVKPIIVRGLASKGGSRPRSNPLRDLIEGAVREDPTISEGSLWKYLDQKIGQGTLVEIKNQSLTYKNGRGRIIITPTSGMKDRLSRAKMKIIRAKRLARNEAI